MKQIGNVAALPGIVHVSISSESLLFFCSCLPGIVAFQMETVVTRDVEQSSFEGSLCVCNMSQ